MNKPRNTEKISPLEILADAITKDTSKTITDMESEGQQSFVMSDTLPTISYDDDKKILESWGFVFGEVVKDDPLFQYCKLPNGWKREKTFHYMHSDILDEKGRKRISVFYRAAWYDRKVNYHIKQRFTMQSDYEKRKAGIAVSFVSDVDKRIWTSNFIQVENDDNYYKALDKTDKEANNWLDQNYPDWRKTGAYWA